jgi:predicted enzyme involved in methoxymalonyl-ACP biosynthesis
MSCRVLKRDMEKAMFDCLVQDAAARGVHTLRGHYYPTAKNLLVKDFYATIGFRLKAEDAAGNREYQFDIPAEYVPQCRVMEIVRG